MLYAKSNQKILSILSVIMVMCQVIFISNFLVSVELAQAETTGDGEAQTEEVIEETAENSEEIGGDGEEATEATIGTAETEADETAAENPVAGEIVPVDYTEDPDSPDNTEAMEILSGHLPTDDMEEDGEETEQAERQILEEEIVIEIPASDSEVQPEATGSDDSSETGSPISLNLVSAPLVGPRVLGAWAMINDEMENGSYTGQDDGEEAGAQFLPSGQFEVNKNISVCAVVINGSGLEGLASTAVKIHNPAGTMEQIELVKLDFNQARELVCDNIKDNNNNLPVFGSGVNFDSLCADRGKISQGQAGVYCANKDMAYYDRAGDYLVQTSAADNDGLVAPEFNISYKYLELTAYAVDFNNLSYGEVQPHSPKVIAGDASWDTPVGLNPATIANVGNTRLKVAIVQNDFGLGKTGDSWNVEYSARIGESEFVKYGPNQAMELNKAMELGEINSFDVGIEVFEFPTETPVNYSGEMTLTVEKAEEVVMEEEMVEEEVVEEVE